MTDSKFFFSTAAEFNSLLSQRSGKHRIPRPLPLRVRRVTALIFAIIDPKQPSGFQLPFVGKVFQMRV